MAGAVREGQHGGSLAQPSSSWVSSSARVGAAHRSWARNPGLGLGPGRVLWGGERGRLGHGAVLGIPCARPSFLLPAETVAFLW